jgi:signal transduction histidine kinase
MFKFRISRYFELKNERWKKQYQKQVSSEFKKTIELVKKSHEESLEVLSERKEREKQELIAQFEKERQELLAQIQLRDEFIRKQKEEHLDKQKLLIKRLEVEDQKRVQQLALLQEKLEHEIQVGQSYHLYWEHKVQFLRNIIHEIEAKLRARNLLNDEIIARMSHLKNDADEFKLLEEYLLKHQNKVFKENRTITDPTIEIPRLEEILLKPDET